MKIEIFFNRITGLYVTRCLEQDYQEKRQMNTFGRVLHFRINFPRDSLAE